jgi:hypothetical protein
MRPGNFDSLIMGNWSGVFSPKYILVRTCPNDIRCEPLGIPDGKITRRPDTNETAGAETEYLLQRRVK